MKPLYLKFLVILLLILGEALSIYAELVVAKAFSMDYRSIFKTYWKMFIVIILAGELLMVGYLLGFHAFRNIWLVSVISITSILIIEPILDYTIFQQLPTKGAIVGFAFGVLGFISTIFF